MAGSKISLPWPFGVGGITLGGPQIITPSFNWAGWVVSPNVHKSWSLLFKAGSGLTVSFTCKQCIKKVKCLKEINQGPVWFMASEFSAVFFFFSQPKVIFWLVPQMMVLLFNFNLFPTTNLFFLSFYHFSRWVYVELNCHKHLLSCQCTRSGQKCLYRYTHSFLFLYTASMLSNSKQSS